MVMIRRAPVIAAALALASIACVARAQTPAAAPTSAPAAAGMVDDPCANLPPEPAVITAYRRAVYATAPGAAPPTPSSEVIAAAGKIKADQVKRDWPDLCHYHADDMRLIAGPASGRRVVFMGDSITQNWGAAHAAFFTDGRVDRGISGQTSPQMLLRFEADVIALHPQAVHIMCATNDIAGNTGPTSLAEIQDNIVAMVTLARASHIRVILASVPPTARFTWAPTLTPAGQVRAVNAWLKAYAEREGLTYVDYYPVLATPEGAMRPGLTLDGVHPNAAGYAAMEPLTLKAIAEALRR